MLTGIEKFAGDGTGGIPVGDFLLSYPSIRRVVVVSESAQNEAFKTL